MLSNRIRKSLTLLTAFAIAHAPASPAFAQNADAALAAETAARAEAAKQAEADAKAKAERAKKVESQTGAQSAAKSNSAKNAEKAAYLSAGLSIAGVATMIAAQVTQDPGTKQTLSQAGMILTLGGQAAGLAGKAMSANADKAGENTTGLDSLSGLNGTGEISSGTGTGTGTGTGAGPTKPVVKLETPKSGGFVPNDPEIAKAQEELDKVLDNFESTTGLPRSDILNALNSGQSPADYLDGKYGLTKDGVNTALANKQSEIGGGSLSGGQLKDLAAKVGMGELAGALVDGETSDYAGGGSAGGGGGSGASSLPPLDFGGLMPPTEAAPSSGRDLASAGEFNFERDVNPEIKKQLLAQGVVQGTIFQMVSARYKAMAPGMLGYGPTENKN